MNVETSSTTQETNTTPENPSSMVEGQIPSEANTDASLLTETSEDAGTSEPSDKDKSHPTEEPPTPIEYTDFSTPEGVKLDVEAITEFKGLAAELGLSQENAQKVVDLGPKLLEKWQAAQSDQLSTAVAEWANTARTDQEIGGDTFDEKLAISRKALEAFGTKELKTLLNQSGLGNHPEIIRAFYRAGKAISEDHIIRGDSTTTKANGAKSFYPNSNMN